MFHTPNTQKLFGQPFMKIHRTHYDTAKVAYRVAPKRLPQPRSISKSPRQHTVAQYVAAARSAATRRAYAQDIAHFKSAGFCIPCTGRHVARYLAKFAPTLAVATLRRRLAAISHAHTAINRDSPVASEIVKTVMRGIRRSKGTTQRKVQALDIRALMTTLKAQKRCNATSTAIWLRNRALLLVGFAGAFRRGELVSLKVADVRWLASGIEVTVQRSKTDQEAVGRKVVILKSRGDSDCCPVRSLARWLDCAELTTGPLFRGVDRHGNVAVRVMHSSSVADIVKASVALAGFDASEFSGHSLRAGYVTAATVANVPIWQIKRVTGHKSDDVVAGYVRVSEANPVRLL